MSSAKHWKNDYPRPTYFQMGAKGLERPGISVAEDSEALVSECLHSIGDLKAFPPKVFIVWLTNAFKDRYGAMAQAVRTLLDERGHDKAPVIGSSVGACIFDDKAHPEGALLIGLGSELMEAWPAVAECKRGRTEQAVEEVVEKLFRGPDLNPHRNRLLIVFTPGYEDPDEPTTYFADEVFNKLREKTFNRLYTFGGASGEGVDPSIGTQILDARAVTNHLVTVLIELNIAFGLGISQGLRQTNLTFTVKDMDQETRKVSTFRESDASDVIRTIEEKGLLPIFGYENSEGDRVIVPVVVPPDKKHVILRRDVPQNRRLHVMETDTDLLKSDAQKRRERISSRFLLHPQTVVAGLGIECVAKHKRIALRQISFDLPENMRALHKLFPWVKHVGCYMHGEIGVELAGRSVFHNWSVSELFIADRLTARSLPFLTMEALKGILEDAFRATSVPEAIACALQFVRKTGYPGAMISLVYKDADAYWIIAEDGIGRKWKEKVVPKTHRRQKDQDLLSDVIELKEPILVLDANDPKFHCDWKAVNEGQIISQYALPLFSSRPPQHAYPSSTERDILGVLQVDLGDRRFDGPLGDEETRRLITIAGLVSGVIDLAISKEELTFTEKLDGIEARCERECRDIDDAANRFSREVATAIGADFAHIRLLTDDGQYLEIVGGHGRYCDEAKECRARIKAKPSDSEPSFTRTCFTTQSSHVINTAHQQEEYKAILDRYKDKNFVHVLKEIRSFANFPVIAPLNRCIGVMNFACRDEWFFKRAKLESLKTVGERFGRLLQHVRERMERDNIFFNAAHFIKSPIAIALSDYGALKRRLASSPDPSLKESGRRVEEAMKLALHQCEAILQRKQGLARPEKVEVAEVIDAMVSLVQCPEARIAMQPANGKVYIMGYRGDIEFCILEVLWNASRHVQQLDLHVDDEAAPITVKLRSDKAQVILEVTNRAHKSMDEAACNEIMINARNGHKNKSRHGDGWGVGLSACLEKAIAMSGELDMFVKEQRVTVQLRFPDASE